MRLVALEHEARRADLRPQPVADAGPVAHGEPAAHLRQVHRAHLLRHEAAARPQYPGDFPRVELLMAAQDQVHRRRADREEEAPRAHDVHPEWPQPVARDGRVDVPLLGRQDGPGQTRSQPREDLAAAGPQVERGGARMRRGQRVVVPGGARLQGPGVQRVEGPAGGFAGARGPHLQPSLDLVARLHGGSVSLGGQAPTRSWTGGSSAAYPSSASSRFPASDGDPPGICTICRSAPSSARSRSCSPTDSSGPITWIDCTIASEMAACAPSASRSAHAPREALTSGSKPLSRSICQ